MFFIFILYFIASIPLGDSHVTEATPDTFDWRNYGVITPVSNQGQIGDAIDFVITESVESLHAIQTKTKAVLLSRQEVTDCCDDPTTQQPMYSGFDCVVAIGGLCADYSHIAGTCNNGSCTPVGKVTATGYVPNGREDFMRKVIHQTPIAAMVDASRISFQVYSEGIYSDQNCSSTQLDHPVQIVGYGTESDVDYWIIKNTWGEEWGEKGYMRILRGKNMCGIASMAIYPINK